MRELSPSDYLKQMSKVVSAGHSEHLKQIACPEEDVKYLQESYEAGYQTAVDILKEAENAIEEGSESGIII